MPQFKDKEKIILSCFGRNPEPIKRLCSMPRRRYYQDHQAKTIVKRPSPMNVRRYGGRGWIQVANRPVRPMSTVVLDEKQKVNLLTDMNEFSIPRRRPGTASRHPSPPRLSPSTAHPVPARRRSPRPGRRIPVWTSSSSPPRALAHRGGPIRTFQLPPRRCVVLLEDIDTAGLPRVPDGQKDELTAATEKTKVHKPAMTGSVGPGARAS